MPSVTAKTPAALSALSEGPRGRPAHVRALEVVPPAGSHLLPLPLSLPALLCGDCSFWSLCLALSPSQQVGRSLRANTEGRPPSPQRLDPTSKHGPASPSQGCNTHRPTSKGSAVIPEEQKVLLVKILPHICFKDFSKENGRKKILP